MVTEAVKKYDKKIMMCMQQNQINRRRNQQVYQQRITSTNQHQWYAKDGKYESVMFVEATPASELMKRVQYVVRRLKFKIKVVERAGATIKGILQRSNPFG